jgi:hypothetical protein
MKMKELHLMYEKGKYNVNVQEYDGKIRIWKAVAKGLCEDEARRIVENGRYMDGRVISYPYSLA